MLGDFNISALYLQTYKFFFCFLIKPEDVGKITLYSGTQHVDIQFNT